jgi:hypothetical protein
MPNALLLRNIEGQMSLFLALYYTAEQFSYILSINISLTIRLLFKVVIKG